MKSDGTTFPPVKPSSTTSVNRTFGVKSDVTLDWSTPGMPYISCVTASSFVVKYSGVKMSPSLAISAIITRLAPPNSA